MTVMGMPRNTTFTEDGKMQQDGLTDAKYDENGYIQSAKMSMQGQEAEVKFTWENGQIVKQTVNAMGQDIATSFVFDEKGLVKTVKMNMMGQDVEIPVTDYKFDDKGNWTSRKMSMMGQEMEEARTITYYE
jgi:antitoxin component YwqK of YwqJK toxin-antitoxin module